MVADAPDGGAGRALLLVRLDVAILVETAQFVEGFLPVQSGTLDEKPIS